MVKFALISAINFDRPIESYIPPLGLAYITAYLKEYLNFEDTVIVDSPNQLSSIKPDILGISSVSQNFGRAIEIAKRIKSNLDIPIIVGGCHISALLHTLPDCFDIGVLGEWEQTVLEIIENFERYGSVKS